MLDLKLGLSLAIVWKMAFRVLRQRKEAIRNAKLNQISKVLFDILSNIVYIFIFLRTMT